MRGWTASCEGAWHVAAGAVGPQGCAGRARVRAVCREAGRGCDDPSRGGVRSGRVAKVGREGWLLCERGSSGPLRAVLLFLRGRAASCEGAVPKHVAAGAVGPQGGAKEAQAWRMGHAVVAPVESCTRVTQIRPRVRLWRGCEEQPSLACTARQRASEATLPAWRFLNVQESRAGRVRHCQMLLMWSRGQGTGIPRRGGSAAVAARHAPAVTGRPQEEGRPAG